MKIRLDDKRSGTILMMTLISISILTFICATTLYITSQNANAATQTTSWHQAMAGAEAAVDMAMSALNNDSWDGWYSITAETSPSPAALPIGQPSVSTNPSATPANGKPTGAKYNYYTSTFTLSGEASNRVTTWVTIDDGSCAPIGVLSNNGQQSYRIRATAMVEAPGPKRVSNNSLDNELRKISLRYNRLTGTANTGANGQAIRRIELVAVPATVTPTWDPAIFLKGAFNMSGGGIVDSFKSSLTPDGLYAPVYRRNNAIVGMINTGGSSDVKSTYVYGTIYYNGVAPKNTKNVSNLVTPFNGAPPDIVTAPSGSYTSYGSGSPPSTVTATGDSWANATLIKINGDLTVPGGQSLTINAGGSGSGTKYIIFWVTGKYTTSGTGFVSQGAGVNSRWYIGGDITTSGSSFLIGDAAPRAAAVTFYGYGTKNKATISGGGSFIGSVWAPNYDVTISGTGAYTGSLVANTLNISGGASFHYDEDLNISAAAGNGIVNYGYASWFEDNSDPSRGIIY